jgi:prefoldin subunit 5
MQRLVSWEFIVGLVIQLVAVAWLIQGRVTTIEANVNQLEAHAGTLDKDHDSVTRLQADMDYVRQAVDDIRRKLDGTK